jgi:integrase
MSRPIEPITPGLKSDGTPHYRRVLADIPRYPTPAQVFEQIEQGEGWPYRTQDAEKLAWYRLRDRALVCLLYLAALRISEALRLTKSQFQLNESMNRWEIVGVKLSKVKAKGKARVHTYRQEVWLPLTGDRARFTELFVSYLSVAYEGKDRGIFYYRTPERALQIVGGLTGMWNHYFRALGEQYLYRQWGNDLLAVADYVKVDPATLGKYIQESYRDKPSV